MLHELEQTLLAQLSQKTEETAVPPFYPPLKPSKSLKARPRRCRVLCAHRGCLATQKVAVKEHFIEPVFPSVFHLSSSPPFLTLAGLAVQSA